MNLAANLRDQIRHSIPAVIVVVIGAWVMIYYSIVQWETMKQVPSWDLAIFSEMAKAYAHLQAPIVPVKGDGFNLLGDHFHPILILLGPIWRLFPTPLSLLITQDLLLAVSAWPLTRLASRLTNQWVGGALGLVYVLSWGMQGAVAAQFHEVAFAMPMLAYASVAFVERRWVAVTAWSAPLVLVKEDMGLTVLMIGVAVILTSLVPAWYRSCTVVDPTADDLDDTARTDEARTDEARNRRRGLRLGAGMMVGGVAAFLFSILVFLPAFHPDGVWGYGLSSEDKPISPDALTQKIKVVVMLILTSGVVGLTSPWLLVVLPTLAWRFLGSVDFYWVWDNWHYNVTLMPIALGALLDVVARLRERRARRAGEPPEKPTEATGATEPAGPTGPATHAGPTDPAGPTAPGNLAGSADPAGAANPAGPAGWLAAPVWARWVVAVGVVIPLIAGVKTAPHLPLWTMKDRAAQSTRWDAAQQVIDTIPEGASVETDLTLLAYLVPKADVSWVGASHEAKDYVVIDSRSTAWGGRIPRDAAQWAAQNRHAAYQLVLDVDGFQVAKRVG